MAWAFELLIGIQGHHMAPNIVARSRIRAAVSKRCCYRVENRNLERKRDNVSRQKFVVIC